MSFYYDNKLGKKGEQAVIKLMESRKHKVIDVSDDEEYQKIDVDLIIDGNLVEVKTDQVMGRTNNLFLEYDIYYFENRKHKLGYYSYTKADYLFYIDWQKKELHIYRMEDLKKYTSSHNCYDRECVEEYKVVRGMVVDKNCIEHQVLLLEGEENK